MILKILFNITIAPIVDEMVSLDLRSVSARVSPSFCLVMILFLDTEKSAASALLQKAEPQRRMRVEMIKVDIVGEHPKEIIIYHPSVS